MLVPSDKLSPWMIVSIPVVSEICMYAQTVLVCRSAYTPTSPLFAVAKKRTTRHSSNQVVRSVPKHAAATGAVAPAMSSFTGRGRRRLPSAPPSSSSPSALSVMSMDFPGAGGAAAADGEKDPRELDPTLEGTAGDHYVKCGKCQACYPMQLEVKLVSCDLVC